MSKFKKEKDHQKHRLHIYKKNDVVKTPKYFYDELHRIYNFDFDPCPVNPVFNGLNIEWGRMNYVNPPFSEIGKWLKKGVEEMEKGKNSLFLITFRPNNKYWLQYIFPNTKHVYLINKGIVFEGYSRELPIPLCLVYFNGKTKKEKKDNNSQTTTDKYTNKRRSNSDLSSGGLEDDHDTDAVGIGQSDHPSESYPEGMQTLPILVKMRLQDIGRSYDRLLGSGENH